jgi:hypothetical protein
MAESITRFSTALIDVWAKLVGNIGAASGRRLEIARKRAIILKHVIRAW